MSNYIDGLREKLALLQEQKDAIDIKMETLQELLDEELGADPQPRSPVAKRKPGRPKGSGGAKAAPKVLTPEQEAFQKEADANLQRMGGGTAPEEAAKKISSFNPLPRPSRDYGPGVQTITRRDISKRMRGEGVAPADATISER